MGHKKRTPSSTTTTPTTTPPPASPDPSLIKSDCEKALTALRRGNHSKSLRLIKDSLHRHPSSPLLHRVHSSILLKSSSLLHDPRLLSSALSSASTAVSLLPSSLEFSLFYATLLFDSNSFDSVVAECDRALSLSSPSDPAADNPLFDIPPNSTKESRIENARQELRSLIQKANLGSISNWMKNLGGGGGEDRVRMFPMVRRVAEDPIEARLLQVRRSNEIKKASKTPEERRKEIEVRVAAARLLQQKRSEGGEEERESSGLRVSGGGGKAGERRRGAGARRNGSISERKDQVLLVA